MKNLKLSKSVLFFTCLTYCIFLASCSKQIVNFHQFSIEVKENSEGGEWYVVDQVRHGDILRVTGSFVWPEQGSAGKHKYQYKIYQGGRLILNGKTMKQKFRSSPTTVLLEINSAALQEGELKVVLFLDGNKYTATTQIVKG